MENIIKDKTQRIMTIIIIVLLFLVIGFMVYTFYTGKIEIRKIQKNLDKIDKIDLLITRYDEQSKMIKEQRLSISDEIQDLKKDIRKPIYIKEKLNTVYENKIYVVNSSDSSALEYWTKSTK